MVVNPINEFKLAQVGDPGGAGLGRGASPLASNPFEDVLSRAVDALEDVSSTEFRANALINDYVAGRAELSDVMVATSKMSIAVQLAVTVITSGLRVGSARSSLK